MIATIFSINTIKLIFCFSIVHIFISPVFGFFNPEYFTYESVAYGVLGNATYTMFEIIQFLLNEDDNIKPLSKKRIIGLCLRPLAAGFLSFLSSALIVGFSSIFGGAVFGFITNSATALVIGLVSGLFFDNFTKKVFLDKIFKKGIEDKFVGK